MRSRLRKILLSRRSVLSTLDMLPIEGKCYSTQEYGLTAYAQSAAGKLAYKNFPGGIHTGVDFGTAGINLPVVALIPGKVVRASVDGSWGNHVEIQGADGWRRQYAHLSSIFVKMGDQVTPGTQLGRVGTTGASTGVHLHYGNRRSKLMGWEYRAPYNDFEDAVKAKMPKKRLIKSKEAPKIYVFNGFSKFRLLNPGTKAFLFGDEEVELVEQDIISKIPEGPVVPSMN